MTEYQISKFSGLSGPSHVLSDLFGEGLCLIRRAIEPVDLTQLGFTYNVTEACSGNPALTLSWCHTSQFVPRSDPFWYAQAEQALRPEHAAGLLGWLDNMIDWKVNDGGFYTAQETALAVESCPPSLRDLFSDDGLAELAASTSALFGVDVELHGPIVAHRMTPGNGVGIHSDRPYPGEETHRLLVFLGRDGELPRGGHFVLFAGPCPEDARIVIPFRHNTGFAFRLNDDSYHAVSVIRADVRYSLILSFREL